MKAADSEKLAEIAKKHSVDCAEIGVVGGDKLTVKVNSETLIDAEVADLEKAYRSTISDMMESK